jgi:DNA polymerase-3 subunit delta'
MSSPSLCPWLFESLSILEQAASNQRLAHAWLITGPDGVGKLDLAYGFADRLLRGRLDDGLPAEATAQAAAETYARLAEAGSSHADLHRVHPEEGKQTIAVDQVRDMARSLGLTPHMAEQKVVVIEGAERMTIEAANALLKTLEEPTRDTYLLLTCSRPGRLPATIRSRCQQLSIRPPDPEFVLDWLGQSGLARGEQLPSPALARSPVVLARELMESGNLSKYSSLYGDIDLVSKGTSDPYDVAERWQKEDLDAALGCLVDRLQQAIRDQCVPELRNRFTDATGSLADNQRSARSSKPLLAQLERAETLRDQFGKGTNMELALKVLLLGLAPTIGRQ